MAKRTTVPEKKSVDADSSEFKGLVARLTAAFGPPGFEAPIRAQIRDEVQSFADELRVDVLGNLIAVKRGRANSARKKILLAAHMDELGVMITHIDQKGFCRFAPLGEIEPLALLGQRCVFKNGTVGVIGRERKKAKSKEIEPERLYLDVGASGPSEARVSVGDAATFFGEVVETGNRLSSRAVDNRLGCAVLIQTLRELHATADDVYFVFTVQGHTGKRGATTASFGIQPDFALAVEVTEAADTPEAEIGSIALGKGVAIKIKDETTLVSSRVRELLIESARRARVPYQLEVQLHGGTEAEAMQISRGGNLVGGVSIPARYLHTPLPIVDVNDAQNTIQLLRALLAEPLEAQLE